MKLYRHGDCFLKEVDTIPAKVKKIGGTTIAKGEITGHHHTFRGNQVQILETPEQQKYIDVNQDSALEHQEHDTITVKKGKYILLMEREINPIEEKIQQVLD